MKFAKIFSAQNHLLKAHIISVEIDISKGLHSFSIVGLPGKAVEEARDRVSAAIKNSGFKSPKQTNAKVIVSLAPADLKKEGPAFDLPIALGYLLASGEIEFDPKNKLFIGELALDGTLRPVRGVLSFARVASSVGIEEIYVPKENAAEAALIHSVRVYGIERLIDIIKHLDKTSDKKNSKEKLKTTLPTNPDTLNRTDSPNTDLDDIIGQETAKRALVIAAAGGHNIAFFGPPGTGKTMLARALASILPPLSFEEALEVTEIHSVAGSLEGALVLYPPVRVPHHTASYTSLVGGGAVPKPGEITLAHRGVLFLDEFPEFDRKVIESLRQPLEDRTISISRSKGSAKFPAHFILIAALNPCPCGNKDIQGKICRCAPLEIKRYEMKLSGPIMDRIDMWIEVSKTEHEKLLQVRTGSKETDSARSQVKKARAIQKERFTCLNTNYFLNSGIGSKDIRTMITLSNVAEEAMNKGAKTYDLSGRGYHRTLRLARTIADLEGSETIEAPHILEALQYRQKHFKKDS